MGRPETYAGKSIGKVPVDISYRIIQLFSDGLYSSPHKAIEELVCNSYDADAKRVDVLVPVPMNAKNSAASIWVVDDGVSMDMEGLHRLWRIAKSEKRKNDPSELSDSAAGSSGRQQIGKFGIGKLATYVLARQVTYICKTYRDGVPLVLAVTMDYSELSQDDDSEIKTEHLELDVRELDAEALKLALEPLRQLPSGEAVVKKLRREDGSCWTAAAMGGLREKAEQIKYGRLSWLLSTALPNSPRFLLYLNGEKIVPKKAALEPLASWQVGTHPSNLSAVAAENSNDMTSISIDGIKGSITGEVEIYTELLDTGSSKSETLLGRSHGFFVMVRGRLVNLDDPLFGRDPLSHSSFARFRMVVNVDGLDEYLTSGRETIMDAPEVQTFREYLKEEFNRARLIYDNWHRGETEAARLSRRIGHTDGALTRRPLARAVERALRGRTRPLTLIETPPDLEESEREDLANEISEAAVSEEGLITSVLNEAAGVERFFARYDAAKKTVYINILHPFYGNYFEAVRSDDLFKTLGVAEVLFEAYLLEEGMGDDIAYRILARRSAVIIARNLLDQADNEKGLEEAAKEAFSVMGYDVTPIGGRGTPDGIAKAVLGYRRETGDRADYAFTYDAKSSTHSKIKADRVNVSRGARHRNDYQAQYSVIVAPNFEGDGDGESAIAKEIRADGKTILMRVADLALLVTVASRRQLSCSRLRGLFESAHMPDEVRTWIDEVWTEPEPIRPFREILDALYHLQLSYPDAVTVPSLNIQLTQTKGLRLRELELTEYLQALATQAPSMLDVSANDVRLNVSPDRLMQEIARQGRELDDALASLYDSVEKWSDEN
jgi:hypothetical protein